MQNKWTPGSLFKFVNSPCMASPVGQTSHREAIGLSGTIHEEAHLDLSYCNQSILKALRLVVAPTICWSSMFHLLTTLLERNTSDSPECASFYLWPLVSLLFLSNVNKPWIPIIDLPWDILKTSVKSCLFLLSSNVQQRFEMAQMLIRIP